MQPMLQVKGLEKVYRRGGLLSRTASFRLSATNQDIQGMVPNSAFKKVSTALAVVTFGSGD